MKKNIFKLAALALTVLSFAACNKAYVSSITKGAVASRQLAENTENAPPAENLHIVNPMGLGGAETDSGYYYLTPMPDGNLNIKFIDFNLMKEVYLCSRPECEHNDDTCKSFVPCKGMIPTIAVNNNMLYIIYTGINLESVTDYPKIIQMEQNGDNRQEITAYNSCSEWSALAADTQNFYMLETKVQQTEAGVKNVSELVQISIATGERKALLTLPEGTAFFADAGGSTIYLQIITTEPSGESITNSIIQYISYDLNTRTEQALFTLDSASGSVVKINKDNIYTVNTQTFAVSKQNILTNEGSVLSENYANEDLVSHIYLSLIVDDRLVINDLRNTGKENVYDCVTAFNLKTGEASPWPLTYKNDKALSLQMVSIAAEYADSFLVVNGWKEMVVTYPNEEPFSLLVPLHALISKDDFWAGSPSYKEIEVM